MPICNLNCLCLSSIVIQTSTCVTGAIKMFRDTRHFCIISIVRKVSYFPDILPNMGFQFSIYGRCCVGGVGISVSTLYFVIILTERRLKHPVPRPRMPRGGVMCHSLSRVTCHMSQLSSSLPPSKLATLPATVQEETVL